MLRPERARRYLENYFDVSRISVFWGNVDDFVQQLLVQEGAKELLGPRWQSGERTA
jgi:hypothetical protein